MASQITFASVRTSVLLIVGIGLLIWNAVFGTQNAATFVVGLMLCGFPLVLNLDNLIRASPVPVVPAPPVPVPATEEE